MFEECSFWVFVVICTSGYVFVYFLGMLVLLADGGFYLGTEVVSV